MPDLSDVKTGTIYKIDEESRTGFIKEDEDGRIVNFDLDDVQKDASFDDAKVNKRVQYIRTTSNNPTAVAKLVIVMPENSVK